LQQRVPAERAAFGVAFDGDADRALFVSANGSVINGDGVLLAVARYLKSQNKLPGNRVVATSMSNLGLERILARETFRSLAPTSATAMFSKKCSRAATSSAANSPAT